MASDFGIASAKLDEDFSIIERLADAIRTEEDVKVSQEDREAIVQDLYEGPKKCQCCINWMTECPHDIDLAALNKEEDDADDGNLVVRRRVTPGNAGSVLSIHSIEVRHAAARKALIDVFEPYDNIVHDLKYLIFLAPFHQFFWRWDRFEQAIAEAENDDVKKVLATLKWLVKRELAEAFAVSKELVSHGVINFKYLWTLFPPGETIYADDMGGEQRFYVLEEITNGRNMNKSYDLSLSYVEWGGFAFGTTVRNLTIFKFDGTKPISDLMAFPSKYLDDLEAVQKKLTERGRKFADLAGMHYKSYRPRGPRGVHVGSEADRRVMIDTDHHLHSPRVNAYFGRPKEKPFMQYTGLITQAPVDSPPVGGHVPLPDRPQFGLDPRYPARHVRDVEYEYEDEFAPRRAPRYLPPPGEVVPVIRPRHVRRRSSVSSVDSDYTPIDPKDHLTDFHFQLCTPWVMGYDLKAREWKNFEVDRIHDIEWNTKPFESLVLPDGYKELILAFVESQVKAKDTFDDVINGKGGGLVALLAGDPGVGKTLTAESVAEKIQAPLFKMDLSDYTEDDRRDRSRSRSRSPPRRIEVRREQGEDFTDAFELAARWGALLLIDECDTYLEKRSDASSKRNRMVSRFLKELEYYPSLLFLTTNRERALDPAIYSRIHLTINYPALDKPSRFKIWQTFLGKNDSKMSDKEFDALSNIEVNGRRIRNIVKTAGIMAKKANRTVVFDDVQKVMKITEGIDIIPPMGDEPVV